MPIAVHVSFAQSQRATGQYPPEESFVVDENVPGVQAIDQNAAKGKQSSNSLSRAERTGDTRLLQDRGVERFNSGMDGGRHVSQSPFLLGRPRLGYAAILYCAVAQELAAGSDMICSVVSVETKTFFAAS